MDHWSLSWFLSDALDLRWEWNFYRGLSHYYNYFAIRILSNGRTYWCDTSKEDWRSVIFVMLLRSSFFPKSSRGVLTFYDSRINDLAIAIQKDIFVNC